MNPRRGDQVSFFGRAKNKWLGSSTPIDRVLPHPQQEEIKVVTTKQTIEPPIDTMILESDNFVSLEKMKAMEANHGYDYLPVVRKVAKKKLRIQFSQDLPEKFLREIGSMQTVDLAKLLFSYQGQSEKLKERISADIDNLALNACYALLVNNIWELDLDRLRLTSSYLLEQSYDIKLVQAINVIIYILDINFNPVQFADVLRSRIDTDCYLNLAGINLYGVNLEKVNLSNANLTNAILSEASLLSANLVGVNLQKANLENTNTCFADFTMANFCGAKLSPFHHKIKPDESGLGSLEMPNLNKAMFINKSKKLTDSSLLSMLDKMNDLNIPPTIILSNIMRNLKNKKLRYSLEELMLLLPILGGHQCFNKNINETENQHFLFWKKMSAKDYFSALIQKEIDTVMAAYHHNETSHSPAP